MSFSTNPFGFDTTLPRSIIDRQSDAVLRTAALAHFVERAPGMDTVEGTWAFDLIEPFCLVLAQAYFDLIDIERRSSLATATGLDLDRLGELYGVQRAPAVPAEGEVTFTGQAGAVIQSSGPTGIGSAVVSTTGANPQVFETTVDAEIPGAPGTRGSINVHVRARTAGAAGNVPPGAVNLVSSFRPGISSVTNALGFTGGQNVQRDGAVNQYYEGYRADIYILANTRGEGGAAKHLRKWARNVPNVGAVKVLEYTPTAGWVTLVLLDVEGRPADAETIHNVEAYIVDPWYLYVEAEDLALDGGATLSGTATRDDATPLGATDNSVLLSGPGQTIRHPHLHRLLRQPGVYRLKPRMKGQGSFSMGVWDNRTADWCWSRPNEQGFPAFATVPPGQPGPLLPGGLTPDFIVPDIDRNQLDFAWDGYSELELRIEMLSAGEVFVDQVNFFAIMSRDDRDVGLSPAGMRVNVVAAESVPINISATVTYSLTTTLTMAMVNNAITDNLREYFRMTAFTTDRTIRRASVENVIYGTPGVGDVNDVVVWAQGSAEVTVNIPISPVQVAELGTQFLTPST